MNLPDEWLGSQDPVTKRMVRELVMMGPRGHVTGGLTSKAHDQTTAVSSAQRESGLGLMIKSGPINVVLPIIQSYFDQPTPENPVVGMVEYNHLSADQFGPLKSNISVPCPLDYSHAERVEKCFSVQEATWGTQGLARLEAIKKKVDPKGLFNCQKCVGFNPDRTMG